MPSQNRHSWQRRSTIWMLLLEVVLIIIGVLLGLAENQEIASSLRSSQ